MRAKRAVASISARVRNAHVAATRARTISSEVTSGFYLPWPAQQGSTPQVGTDAGEGTPTGSQQQQPLQSIHDESSLSGLQTQAAPLSCEPPSVVPLDVPLLDVPLLDVPLWLLPLLLVPLEAVPLLLVPLEEVPLLDVPLLVPLPLVPLLDVPLLVPLSLEPLLDPLV
jgi:hypothetical protein